MKKVNECEIYIYTPDGLSILFNYLEDKLYRIDRTLYLQKTGSGETVFLEEYESEKIAADVLTILIYDCVHHDSYAEIVIELVDSEDLDDETLEHMEYEARVIRRGEKRDGESAWYE